MYEWWRPGACWQDFTLADRDFRENILMHSCRTPVSITELYVLVENYLIHMSSIWFYRKVARLLWLNCLSGQENIFETADYRNSFGIITNICTKKSSSKKRLEYVSTFTNVEGKVLYCHLRGLVKGYLYTNWLILFCSVWLKHRLLNIKEFGTVELQTCIYNKITCWQHKSTCFFHSALKKFLGKWINVLCTQKSNNIHTNVVVLRQILHFN